MKITQIKYGRTINVGNYESVRIDLSANVEENEDYVKALNVLKENMEKLEGKVKRDFKDQIDEWIS